MDARRIILSVFSLCFLGFTSGWLFWNKVCYDTLGCFTVRYPYTNTKGLLPRPPRQLATRILLCLPSGGREELWLHDESTLGNLNQDFLSVIIIHGYRHSVGKAWVQHMVGAFHKKGGYNVILVDWRKGAMEWNYLQSAANIRVVGAEVGAFINGLASKLDMTPDSFHIIGHSLGAHAAGYIGERVRGLGRITGLDPANLAFEKVRPSVRLDPTDAVFVDVIHTDAEKFTDLGFGLRNPIGHADFYPNGGRIQPGCPTTLTDQLTLLLTGRMMSVEDVTHHVGCSHLRAISFFTESINSNCSFQSYPCDIFGEDVSSECTSCKDGCSYMGLNADVNTTGVFYVETNRFKPFCIL